MSEEVADLLAVADQLEEQMRASARQARILRLRVDAIWLESRPDYPTDHQRDGIAAGVELLMSGARAESHNGDPCAPGPNRYMVAWDSTPNRWRLSIRHGAPYSATRTGRKLWDFTDAEVLALLDVVRGTGVRVIDSWRHAEGISVVVRPPGQS